MNPTPFTTRVCLVFCGYNQMSIHSLVYNMHMEMNNIGCQFCHKNQGCSTQDQWAPFYYTQELCLTSFHLTHTGSGQTGGQIMHRLDKGIQCTYQTTHRRKLATPSLPWLQLLPSTWFACLLVKKMGETWAEGWVYLPL